MEPTLQAAHERHVAFHASIAARAAQLKLKRTVSTLHRTTPPPPPAFQRPPRYFVDADYERAWCMELLDFDPRPGHTPPSVEAIQIAVCRHYGITRTDMVSDRRTHQLVRPRQVAVYLCRTLTTKSLPEIGRRFGGRDHTTQLHACRQITKQLKTDIHLQASVEMLTEKLGGDLQ